MTGLVRKATFLVACAMFMGALAAYAGIVSPGNCVIGDGTPSQRINLVGTSTGAGDPLNAADSIETKAKLTILVRDIASNPIAGVPVVLDFSACTPEVRIASTQSYHAQTTGCGTATVQNYTTTNGTVSFVVVGGTSSRVGHTAGCMKVYADSYLLSPTVNVGTFDQNNLGGMNLGDVSLFWGDNGTSQERSNVDNIGTVNLADVSLAWGANGHFNTSGAVLCP